MGVGQLLGDAGCWHYCGFFSFLAIVACSTHIVVLQLLQLCILPELQTLPFPQERQPCSHDYQYLTYYCHCYCEKLPYTLNPEP